MLESMPAEVYRKTMEGFRVACVAHEGPWSDIGVSFRRLLHLLFLRRVRPAGPFMALYDREPKNGAMPTRFDVAVSVGPDAKPGGGIVVRDLPDCEVASLVYDGPPSRYPGCFAVLSRWMRQHGYVRAGPIREIYARDVSELPPGIMYAEIQVPIRPRSAPGEAGAPRDA